MSDFFESFLTPPPPLNPIFTFYTPIFWGHFRPPSPPKIGHHLCTFPKPKNLTLFRKCIVFDLASSQYTPPL